MTDVMVVLMTCANTRQARRIARALVEQRLAACVNILSVPVRSIYHWEGRIDQAQEILVVAKTVRRCLKSLVRQVQELHSYQVPEIVAVPVADGLASYLRWVRTNCRS